MEKITKNLKKIMKSRNKKTLLYKQSNSTKKSRFVDAVSKK